MTVAVLIERDSAGRLHGYVQERRPDGFLHRGEDLLKDRVFRNIDSATIECDRKILAMFKLIDAPRIDYVLPNDIR